MKKKFFQILFWLALLLPKNSFAQNENQTFETVKLEILCKTIRFIVSENNSPRDAEILKCKSIESLFSSIPPESSQALLIFNMFRNKAYESFGKNKVNIRLNKLIKDIQTELTKLNRSSQWNENVQVLQVQLGEIKTEILAKIQNNTYQPEKSETTPQNTSKPQKTQNTEEMPIYLLIFILLLLAGGIGFLAWQNQELKKQIIELEELQIEKYSRLDNRIDTLTPVRDFQALLLKFNFTNEQLNALIQEVMVMKQRNEYKISAQELYSKRTEHLEKQSFNPDVQIYYTKYRPDLQGFSIQDFKTEASRDSIYKIELNINYPNQAIISITDRSEFHQVAIANYQIMLTPVCDYELEPYNDTKILSLEKGIIEKKESHWQVVKKMKVAFQ